ncbi:MAG TPA: FHA domain-containing protein [Variovorax sp.]|jgi:pSer/pThr/pTyr-binding forkhead associated (FHA) protein
MTRLIVLQKNGSAKQVNVLGSPFMIGRSDACDLLLDNQLVSRSHAVIETAGDAIAIRDLQSHNGTFVNGERVQTTALKNGDEIRIGGYQIRFLSRSGPIADAEALRLVTVPGRLTDIDLQRLGSK